MTKFEQSPETKRFVRVYEELLNKDLVNNQVDFCEKISSKDYRYQGTAFTHVIKGRRDVPAKAVNALIRTFSVCRDYIYEGVLPIFAVETPKPRSPKDQTSEDFCNNVDVLRKQIEMKDRIIKLQEEQLDMLKRNVKKL